MAFSPLILILRTLLTPLTAEETGLERGQWRGVWEIKPDSLGTGEKDGFSSEQREGRALEPPGCVSLCFAFPGPAEGSGQRAGAAHFLPIVSTDLHFERTNYCSLLLSSPQEGSFV